MAPLRIKNKIELRTILSHILNNRGHNLRCKQKPGQSKIMAQVSTQHSASLDELISQSKQVKKSKQLEQFINRCELFISRPPADDADTQKECLSKLLNVLETLQKRPKFSNHKKLHSLVSQITEDILPNPYSLAQQIASWEACGGRESDKPPGSYPQTSKKVPRGFLYGRYARRKNH